MATRPDFVAAASDLTDELVALRRTLHADPEIGLLLPRTQAAVLDALADLPLEITTGTTLSSITAVLRGGRPGPAVLLRGDMDALPVVERTGLAFAASNGAMHACGHDLHVAGLVGAAQLLAAHRDELPGSVVFMFQPGEEGLGGARHMIDEGVLDAAGERVIAAYGVHVMPGPRGTFETKPGPLMASGNRLFVTVHGVGGHGSQAWSAVDPVSVLMEIGTALEVMITRRFSVTDPVVLSVTQLAASDAVNVIPSSAKLGATIRTLSAENVPLVGAYATRVAEHIAAAHGCTAEVVFEPYYPPTINDADEARFTLDTLADVFGAARVSELDFPMMASEDFSFVLREVPGCFVFLLSTPPDADPDQVEFNHSARVLFDDAVLADQAAALASLAWDRLAASAR